MSEATILESVPEASTESRALSPISILDRAVAMQADPDVLGKLMDLQERHERNEARKAFDRAMAALRGDLPAFVKMSEVDFTTSKGRTNYKHEDLGYLTRELSPIMARHGLSFRWRTGQNSGCVMVTCIIAHEDGHSEETTLSAQPDNSGNKNPIQAVGSAVTYLQRYTLKAAVGIAASVDDDGRGGPDQPRPAPPAPASGPGPKPAPVAAPADPRQEAQPLLDIITGWDGRDYEALRAAVLGEAQARQVSDAAFSVVREEMKRIKPALRPAPPPPPPTPNSAAPEYEVMTAEEALIRANEAMGDCGTPEDVKDVYAEWLDHPALGFPADRLKLKEAYDVAMEAF